MTTSSIDFDASWFISRQNLTGINSVYLTYRIGYNYYMTTVKQIMRLVQGLINSDVPEEVRITAREFLDAMSDFDLSAPMSLEEANRVWNEDLAPEYKNKYPLK